MNDPQETQGSDGYLGLFYKKDEFELRVKGPVEEVLPYTEPIKAQAYYQYLDEPVQLSLPLGETEDEVIDALESANSNASISLETSTDQNDLLTLESLYQEKKPERQTDQILLMTYLQIKTADDSLTVKEYKDYFRQLRRHGVYEPANISDCLARLIKKGYIYPVDDKAHHRSYSLTVDGEEYVEAELRA